MPRVSAGVLTPQTRRRSIPARCAARVSCEDYYELDGEHYHEECFEDKAVDILLDQFGAMKSIAEVDQWD